MTTPTEKLDQHHHDEDPADLHDAAIIDSQGHEIPITEEMVKEACEKLEDSRGKAI